ncbi:MAG TPA: vitamin K epoxide reductase family protein, partial [Leptolinea sp.]
FAGFIFSIYLTYLEIAVIKALCPFCIVSAVMMTVLFISTLLRLVQNRSEYTLSLEDKNG